MKLELTHIEPLSLLDTDTYDTILAGRMTKEIVEMNMSIYDKCDIVTIGNVTFAVCNYEGRKFIHPFKVNVGTRLYHYAFLCYTPNDGQLYWFFKGLSKTKNREEALRIYDALVDYCKGFEDEHIPLIVKR